MQNLTEEQKLFADAAFAQKLNVVHHAYVDICGDLTAGALLGQILYWLAPQNGGEPRARIEKEGYRWIAKARADWWDEIRISPKQYDRAIKVLEDKRFVEVRTMKFDGNPMKHIRIIPESINSAVQEWKKDQVKTMFPNGEKPTDSKAEAPETPPLAVAGSERSSSMFPDGQARSLPLGNNELNLSGISSYTENTTEIITENTNNQTQGESAKTASNEFERIWKEYPKKEGKAKARKAFLKALKGQGLTKADGTPYTADEIYVKTVLYRQYASKMIEIGELAYRYVPTGGNWFENESWADAFPDIADKFESFEDGMNYSLQANKMRLLAGEIAKTGDMDIRGQIEQIAVGMPY